MNIATTLLACLLPVTAVAQGNLTRVEYDVEFSVAGSLLDRNCAASGTDRLVGTLTGYEPAEADEPQVYVGMLRRTTRINICGSRTNPTTGTDVVCSMSVNGDATQEVMLTIEPGQREGYLQYITDRAHYAALLATLPQQTGLYSSQVTGTCDGAEMEPMQNEYNLGQTGGSPSGQPIRIAALPAPFYPINFAPAPPVSIWSLKVIRRRVP
jgi:hypothetical protein